MRAAGDGLGHKDNAAQVAAATRAALCRLD